MIELFRKFKKSVVDAIVQDDPNPEYSYLDRLDGLK